jgi:hypothetical protein
VRRPVAVSSGRAGRCRLAAQAEWRRVHPWRFFIERVSMQQASAGSVCAILRSSPRWIFCDRVSGSASTNAT